jgi:hypothetical protein
MKALGFQPALRGSAESSQAHSLCLFYYLKYLLSLILLSLSKYRGKRGDMEGKGGRGRARGPH